MAKVKARVLSDCSFGKCNDVVEVEKAELDVNRDVLDGDKAAVAYAATLPQNSGVAPDVPPAQ